MTPFTDRQRAALARCHGYTMTAAARLRRRAPWMDDADIHDIATDALIRATRDHDSPPWPHYARHLELAYIDWARSPRNVRGRGRTGFARPAPISTDFRGIAAPGRNAAAAEEAEALLDALPSRLRRILELEFRGGYFRREIAAMSGVSEATIWNERAEAFARARGEPAPSRNSRTRHARP